MPIADHRRDTPDGWCAGLNDQQWRWRWREYLDQFNGSRLYQRSDHSEFNRTRFHNVYELGSGNGGNITANVGTLSVTNGATISSNNFSLGQGQGGNVIIQGLQGSDSAADSVTLSNGSGFTISTLTSSDSGRGGDVRITADRLLIENNSQVSTDTLLGSGMGGNLSLNVRTLDLKGGDLGGSSVRSSNSASGTDVDFDGVPDVFNAAGGNVTIQGINGAGGEADSVILSGGSRITSETIVGGGGGRVSIAATSLNLDGTDLNGTPTTISSVTQGIGRGGDIVVSFQNASLSGAATIASQTILDDPAAAAGGNITVQGLDGTRSKADALTLAGFRSGLISETFGSGRPGDIEMYAKTVSLTDGAVVEAGNPQSTGTGGNVVIEAVSVEIVGNAGIPDTESHISSQASGQDAGQVTIKADQLILDNGSIAGSTVLNTPGRGGDVTLSVGSVSLLNGATINSSTAGTGRAGDITMNIGTLTLTDNAEISSNSQVTASGDAGIVTIQGPGGPGTSATSVSLTNSSLLTNSEGTGAGGKIQIRAGQVQLADLAYSPRKPPARA